MKRVQKNKRNNYCTYRLLCWTPINICSSCYLFTSQQVNLEDSCYSTEVKIWYLRCSTRLTLWISKFDKIICTVLPLRNKKCVWWLTGAKKWTIRDPQIRIFRAALPVIATNLANQQGNHDIVQLQIPISIVAFSFCLFFLKNIRLPMFFPLKDWGFPVSEP